MILRLGISGEPVGGSITGPHHRRVITGGDFDNTARYTAQSALTGIEMRDGGPAPLLPTNQAQDVLRWRKQ